MAQNLPLCKPRDSGSGAEGIPFRFASERVFEALVNFHGLTENRLRLRWERACGVCVGIPFLLLLLAAVSAKCLTAPGFPFGSPVRWGGVP